MKKITKLIWLMMFFTFSTAVVFGQTDAKAKMIPKQKTAYDDPEGNIRGHGNLSKDKIAAKFDRIKNLALTFENRDFIRSRDAVLFEGFETWPPAGWTLDSPTGDNWIQDDGTDHGPGSVYEGTYAAMYNNYDISSGDYGSMTTPAFDVSALDYPTVSFYWWNDDGSYNPATLEVLSSTDGTTFTSIDTIEVYNSDGWVQYSHSIGTDVTHVKLTATSDYGFKNTFVDAFEIKELNTNPVLALNYNGWNAGLVQNNNMESVGDFVAYNSNIGDLVFNNATLEGSSAFTTTFDVDTANAAMSTTPDQAMFSISLFDSWGDGWNGGSLDVIVDGNVVLDDITIDVGSQADFTFMVNNGSTVETIYTAGSYSSENSYAIYNNIGDLVIDDGTSGGVPTGVIFTAANAPGTYMFGFSFTPTTAGEHTATLTIESNGGTEVINLVGNAYLENSMVESFETAVPPNGWEANILNGTYNWEKAAVGAIGDYSAMYNSYSASPGESAELITPQLDLTARADNMLYFYYAHPTTYSFCKDTLKLYVSEDNGETWGLLDEIMIQDFYWHLMSYDLSAYSGDEFKVKFVGISDWGQSIYIDNVVAPKLVNGNLVGYVYDEYTGEPIEGAVITLGSQTAVSNSFGLYSIEQIPIGTYTVTCEFPEYKTITEEIVITFDSVTEHNFYLIKPAVFNVDVAEYTVKLEPNQQVAKSFTISNDAEVGADSLNYEVAVDFNTEGKNSVNYGIQENAHKATNFEGITFVEGSLGENSELAGTYQGGIRADLICPEGSIFNNNATGYTGATTSEVGPGYTAAQHFLVPGSFNTVTFWGINAIYSGGWSNCDAEDPMEFEINVYEDGATPGALISSTTVSVVREGTGEMFSGAYEIYQYTANIPPVTLSSGWISIQGQTAAEDCWFLWVGGGSGTGDAVTTDGTGWTTASYGPFSICLSEIVSESWLTVTDGATGSIAPGDSATVNIFFDATDLVDVEKNANIVITHNGIIPDKDTGSIIPVEMTVTPFVHNVSIFDIQFTTDPDGVSPLVDTTVRTTGVITAGDGGSKYFLQDMEQTGSWNGILVYSQNMTFDIGDEVSVVGKVAEFDGMTEIIADADMTSVLSTGNTLPAPLLVSTGSFGEPFEGLLLAVENAECTTEANSYGEWSVNDGTGDGVIDNSYYDYEPTLGHKYNVVGPLDYSYGAFKIQPRDAGDVEDITNELLWPPFNLAADVQYRDVVLTWDEPSQYGWNGYYPGPQYLTWAGPERATYFDVTDFGFSYPIDISSISHGFYQHGAYPWGDDTTFTVKIYDADGSTLLYESEVLTALPQWNTTILELDSTLTLTDNFWVAIAPTNTETGMPSSLCNADNSNGYVGEPGAWELYYEWSTMVYMEGDGPGGKIALKPSNAPMIASQANLKDCIKLKDSEIPSAPKYLKSYNVYRNGSLIADGITDLTYTDAGLDDGIYTYYTTTVWTAGESGASNIVTAQLFYGALEGTVKDAEYGTPIADAIVESTDGVYTTTTDVDGNFVFDEMLYGTYDFNVSADGYYADTLTGIEIVQDDTTTVEFELDREYLAPLNVAVDPYYGIISWNSPFGLTYDDDFEDYTVGGYLAEQSDAWTTWDNAPGTPQDGLITDTIALSGSKSVKVDGTTDLVLEMGNQTSGVWEVNINMFFSADGDGGYYNILHDFNGGVNSEWAYEVYFDEVGNAILYAAGDEISFTYNAAEWNHFKTIVNLNADSAELYVNDVKVHSWKWSLQTDGTQGINQLGAMDIFAASLGGANPLYYFDDVSYGVLQGKEVVAKDDGPEFLHYNVYLNGFKVTETNNLQYQYEDLALNMPYTGSVSAIYSYMGDLHESEIIDVDFTFLPTDIVAPTDLVATVTNFNDVELTWVIPETGRLLESILIFRDGEQIDEIAGTNTSYTEVVGAGIYEYYVQAKYTGFQLSDPSNVATAEVVLPAPRNLTAENEDYVVALQWEVPIIPNPGDEFTEGFEDAFPPTGWTHEQTNTSETWEQVGTVSFSSGDVVPHEGEKQLECYWDYDDQDEWMITPEFMADETTTLTFWTYIHNGSTYGDHYYLKVSADGGTTWDVVWDASAQPTGDNHYDYAVVVDLSAYEGENINLAWQGYAIGGLWYAWFIDDVTVATADGVYAFNGETLQRKVPIVSEITHQGQLSRDGKTKVTEGNNRALTGYNIYRNDELIASTSNTHYIDELSVNGVYNYYVKANYDGFESDTSNNVTVSCFVGVEELTLEKSIKVYPNPATNQLNVKVSNDIKEIKVYNYVGQVVYGTSVTSTKTIQINTSEYKAGIYLMQFTTENGKTITKKVVIIN